MTVNAELVSELFRSVAKESGLHILNLSMEVVAAGFSPVAVDKESGQIRYGILREGGIFVFDRRRPVGQAFITHFAGWQDAADYVELVNGRNPEPLS